MAYKSDVEVNIFQHADWDMESTSNWSAGGQGSGLATSTTRVEGSFSLSFDKSGTGGTNAYIENTSLAAADLSTYENKWAICGWVNISDITNVDKVRIWLGSDANFTTNYSRYDIADSYLTNGWNLIFLDLDSPTATDGTTDFASIDSIRIEVIFDSNTDTLNDILVDNFFVGCCINSAIEKNITDWEIDKTAGKAIDMARIMVIKKPLDDYPELNPGKRIKIYLNDTKVFDGYVELVDRQVSGKITCKDLGYELMRINVLETYRSQTISSIVTDIINDFTTLDSSGVTSTSITLEKFVCDEEVAYDLIKKLADTLNWQFYTDINGVFYFEPKGSTASGFTFTVGSNCRKLGQWKFDKTKLKNSVTVVGDKRNFTTEDDTFEADGIGSVYTLTYKPATFTRVTREGIEQKGGLEDVTTNPAYYVDGEAQQIITVGAWTSGDDITTSYDYAVPIKIEMEDGPSITNYGQHDIILYDRTLKTRDDAREYANKYLQQYSTPFTQGKILTEELTLEPGQTCRVVDSFANIDETFVMKDVRMRYPEATTEIVVGTEEYRSYDYIKGIDERVKKLERALGGDVEVVTNIKSYTHSYNKKDNMTLHKIQFKSGADNSFIWGHKYAIWGSGTSLWGKDNRSGWETLVEEAS